MNDPGDRQVQPDPVDSLPADFAAFFTQVQMGWLRYAYNRLRNRQDAEDAVQDAGIKVLQKWGQVLAAENYQAFAHTIMRGVVADYWRARSRAARREQAVRDAARDKACLEQLAHLSRYDVMDRAMEQLEREEPVQAECVRLRVAGYGYAEISVLLGITPGTARTYYSRGRSRAEELARHYLRDKTERGEPS